MRVEELLKESARRMPAHPAVVAGKKSLTYAELEQTSDRFAGALAAQGAKRGDHVALFLDNSFAAVVATFGVMKAGGVSVLVDPAASADELATALNRGRAIGIVTESRLASVAGKAMLAAPSARLVVLAGAKCESVAAGCIGFEDTIASGAAYLRVVPAQGGADAAFLLRAAGSAGFPDGVTMTHDQVCGTIGAEASVEPAGRVSLPFSSARGLTGMLSAIRAGKTLILDEAFAFTRPLHERAPRGGESGRVVAGRDGRMEETVRRSLTG